MTTSRRTWGLASVRAAVSAGTVVASPLLPNSRAALARAFGLGFLRSSTQGFGVCCVVCPGVCAKDAGTPKSVTPRTNHPAPIPQCFIATPPSAWRGWRIEDTTFSRRRRRRRGGFLAHWRCFRSFRNDDDLKGRRVLFAELGHDLRGGCRGRVFDPLADFGLPVGVAEHGHKEALRAFFFRGHSIRQADRPGLKPSIAPPALGGAGGNGEVSRSLPFVHWVLVLGPVAPARLAQARVGQDGLRSPGFSRRMPDPAFRQFERALSRACALRIREGRLTFLSTGRPIGLGRYD